MRPLSPSAPPPGLMSSCETNDKIFLILNQINRGSPIPDDVIEINPYQYDPSNLPVQVSIEQKTTGLMYEYKVTPKGQHDQTKLQESALCRFFSLWNDLEHNDEHDVLGHLSLIPSVNPDTSGNDGQRSTAEPQANRHIEWPGSSLVDKSRDQSVDDKEAEIDCIIRGDYLELNDLVDGASHDSSSSENTSRQSFASDECFDYLELLADLDDEKKEDLSGKGSTSNHNIMMCEIANDVVVQPGPLGFLFKGSDAKAKETQQAPDNDKSKSPDQAAKKLEAECTDEGPSHARRATTSSSSSNSSSDEPGRAARREEKRSKKLMKFLCFMPF